MFACLVDRPWQWGIGFPLAEKCDIFSDQHGMVTFEFDVTKLDSKENMWNFVFWPRYCFCNNYFCAILNHLPILSEKNLAFLMLIFLNTN